MPFVKFTFPPKPQSEACMPYGRGRRADFGSPSQFIRTTCLQLDMHWEGEFRGDTLFAQIDVSLLQHKRKGATRMNRLTQKFAGEPYRVSECSPAPRVVSEPSWRVT